MWDKQRCMADRRPEGTVRRLSLSCLSESSSPQCRLFCDKHVCSHHFRNRPISIPSRFVPVGVHWLGRLSDGKAILSFGLRKINKAICSFFYCPIKTQLWTVWYCSCARPKPCSLQPERGSQGHRRDGININAAHKTQLSVTITFRGLILN